MATMTTCTIGPAPPDSVGDNRLPRFVAQTVCGARSRGSEVQGGNEGQVQQLCYHRRSSDNAGKGQEPNASVNPEQQTATITIFDPRTATPGEGLCFHWRKSHWRAQQLHSTNEKGRKIHGELDEGYQADHRPSRLRVIGRRHPPGGLVTPALGVRTLGVLTVSTKVIKHKSGRPSHGRICGPPRGRGGAGNPSTHSSRCGICPESLEESGVQSATVQYQGKGSRYTVSWMKGASLITS
jgi:hypothetical protein